MERSTKKKLTCDELFLIGALKFKEIGKPLLTLSDECVLNIIDQSDLNFQYLFYMKNEEPEEGTDKAWNNLSFTITPECKFKLYNSGNYCLMWEKDSCFYIFEILIDDNNKANLESILEYLRDCVTSNNFKQPISEIQTNPFKYSTITPLKNIDNIDKYLEENYQHYRRQPLRKDAAVDEITNKLAALELETKELKKVINTNLATKVCGLMGEFYIYNPETDSLNKYVPGKTELCIYLTDPSLYEYKIIVCAGDVVFNCQSLDESTRTVINDEEKNFMWLSNNAMNTSTIALCFKFDKPEQLSKLRVAINKALYESSSKASFEKLDDEGKEYYEHLDNVEEDIDQEKVLSDSDFAKEFKEKESEKMNKFTAQSFLRDRTFSVMTDNSINVYKTNDDTQELEVALNIPAVKEYNDKDLCFSKGQLSNGETRLLLLDKNNTKSIFEYDLGKAKIVNEWNVNLDGNDTNIMGIVPQAKKDQMTGNQLFYGFDKNSVFGIDGRINNKNKATGEYKVYKTPIDNTCMVSNGFANFATGSAKGEIRLYKQMGQGRATTNLKGNGDPIIGIDVTMDGKYVLATCKKYLLFVCTVSKGNDTETGFTSPIKKYAPVLKTLKIKPTDIKKYHLEDLCFTPAKFNIGEDMEQNIITSIGDYIIVWNLNKVKKNYLSSYKIKKVSQVILENQYKYNKNQVVVTMPTTLRIQDQQ
ncbi:MAG: hypothetical protein MJ252_16995 [archaeon]|nr:hypothetical protein [archaeon]